jgi:hypothetical protein
VTHPHTKALAELVACKNLKDKAERGVTVAGNAEQRGMCASFEEQASAFAEYARRQPLAWDAAQAALASPQEQAPRAEPVAEVCAGWTIRWVGAEPIATLLARHPNVRIGTKLYASSPGAAEAGEAVTNEMVSRFLSWSLPKDFCPDGGINFGSRGASGYEKLWPTGTNLFTAVQARAMLNHVLGGKK